MCWGEASLTFQIRTSPVVIEQRENMPESKHNEYISPRLCLSFSISLISNLDHPPIENTGAISHPLSPNYYSVKNP